MACNDINKRAITNVYKNAHIALQSIADILPSCDDKALKAHLKEEYEGYEKIIGEIATFMKAKGLEPKDINPMKKAMLWTSIKMKTMMDKSRNLIAEMMIKGTVIGINELTAMKNESANYDKEIVVYIEKLLALEEQYEQELKTFL